MLDILNMRQKKSLLSASDSTFFKCLLDKLFLPGEFFKKKFNLIIFLGIFILFLNKYIIYSVYQKL